jgi:hypothetical protein
VYVAINGHSLVSGECPILADSRRSVIKGLLVHPIMKLIDKFSSLELAYDFIFPSEKKEIVDG